MLFSVTKIVGLLVEPYNLAVFLAFCVLVLRLLRRGKRARRVLLWTAGGLVLVFGFGPVANLLLYPLETAHARPARPPKDPGAIIVLGGFTREPRDNPNFYELTEAADRFVEGVRLAHNHPRARLVISSGSSAVIYKFYKEGNVLGSLALDMGLPARQVVVDAESRNTRENALYSKRLLSKVKGPLLLITSAAHMSRAVACFRKAGVEVVPWPVDYLRTGSGPGSWLPKPANLGRSNAALHEYAGWLYYWLVGYV